MKLSQIGKLIVIICGLTLFDGPAASAVTLDWMRQIATSTWEVSSGVSADGIGSVYISGLVYPGPSSSDTDPLLAKYDAAGNLQWTRQLDVNTSDHCNGVSADGLGNVYITGQTLTEAYVTMYNAFGDLLWTRYLEPTSGATRGYAISADGLGSVYVTGAVSGDLAGPRLGGRDVFVAKYDAAGNSLWVRQVGTARSETAYGLSADKLGNVYLTGDVEETVGGPEDAFVTKFNAAGDLIWSHQFETFGMRYDRAGHSAASADGLGNVYISGVAPAGNATAETFLRKYDQAGNLLWGDQFASARSIGTSVSADGEGNVYVASSDLGIPFVRKYDSAGTFQWREEMTPSSGGDQVYGLSTDRLGSVYMSGSFAAPPNDWNAFVVKFSDNLVPEPSTFILVTFAMISLPGRSRFFGRRSVALLQSADSHRPA